MWNVRYHDNLDQLLISSGSDGVVKLWNMNSLSSNSSSLPQGPAWDKGKGVRKFLSFFVSFVHISPSRFNSVGQWSCQSF